MYLVSLIVGLLFGVVHPALEIPKGYKQCKRGPEFNDCMVAAMNDALPKLVNDYKALGLSKLEPFIIPSLKIERQTGPVSIRQEYIDLQFTNFLLKTKIERFSLDESKNQINLVFYKEKFDVTADCILNGRILIVPIQGHGHCAQNYTGLRIHLKMTYKSVEKNGEIYWHFTSIETRLEKPESIFIKYENLFNGNKELTESTNKFLNENWAEIFQEIKPTYEQAFSQICIKIINKVFDQFPISKIFPE